MTEPSPCPDCDATQTVVVGMIARRDGSRAPIEYRETEHASTCPTLRGITS
jgi:hypothetical protein